MEAASQDPRGALLLTTPTVWPQVGDGPMGSRLLSEATSTSSSVLVSGERTHHSSLQCLSVSVTNDQCADMARDHRHISTPGTSDFPRVVLITLSSLLQLMGLIWFSLVIWGHAAADRRPEVDGAIGATWVLSLHLGLRHEAGRRTRTGQRLGCFDATGYLRRMVLERMATC